MPKKENETKKKYARNFLFFTIIYFVPVHSHSMLSLIIATLFSLGRQYTLRWTRFDEAGQLDGRDHAPHVKEKIMP